MAKKKPKPPPKTVCNHLQRDGILDRFLPHKMKGKITDCPTCGGEIIAAPMSEEYTSIPIADTNTWWHLDPQPAPVRCRDPVVTYYRGGWHSGHHTWGGYASCQHTHHTCPPGTTSGGFPDSPTLF